MNMHTTDGSDAPASIDTPAGRVTVGERWEHVAHSGTRHPFTVTEVKGSGIGYDYDDGTVGFLFAADFGGFYNMRRVDPKFSPFTLTQLQKWERAIIYHDETTPDPRAAREQRRREIDAVLREDARQRPAFVRARQAAVMAACEGAPPFPPDEMIDIGEVRGILAELHAYEDGRGGMRKPSAYAERVNRYRVPLHLAAIDIYERARGLP